MDDTIQQILSGIDAPSVTQVDPREGVHEAAVFIGATLGDKSTVGWTTILTFGSMVDTNGRDFEMTQVTTIPTVESPDFIQRRFLALLHDLDILGRDQREYKVPVTEEHVEAYANLLNLRANKQLKLKISTDKNGFTRVDIQRQKVRDGHL